MTRLPAQTVWYLLEFLLSAPNFIITAVYFVRDVHMSPLQLVLTGTAMEIVYFLSEIPTGAIATVQGWTGSSSCPSRRVPRHTTWSP